MYGLLELRRGDAVVTNSGMLKAGSISVGRTVQSSSAHFINTGRVELYDSLYLSGNGSHSTFTMKSGTLISAGALGGLDGSGTLNLHGGTMTFAKFWLPAERYKIDVRGSGKLIIKGNIAAELNQRIAAGSITGDAGMTVVYDDRTHTTRLTAK